MGPFAKKWCTDTNNVGSYIARASASERYIFKSQNKSAYNVKCNQCGLLSLLMA